MSHIALLIEPFGIEIWDCRPALWPRQELLIEPFGIEIRYSLPSSLLIGSFNRTFWN